MLTALLGIIEKRFLVFLSSLQAFEIINLEFIVCDDFFILWEWLCMGKTTRA